MSARVYDIVLPTFATDEISMTELRYAFGKNWDEFVSKHLSESAIQSSEAHLKEFLRRDRIDGSVFLDIGCGSGIHSLAALRMGASEVISFDYDPDSVATAIKVHEWAKAGDKWKISQGSVLDVAFMNSLPKADLVYSWGVLHHTGDMWPAIRNAAIPLKPQGEFYIALYATENYVDPDPQFWKRLKRAYNLASPLTRAFMEVKYTYWRTIRDEIANGRDPLSAVKQYGQRGMDVWTDTKDWLGGYPIEFAGYVETRDFCREELGLDLVNALTGEGCSEYLFARKDSNPHWKQIERQRVPIVVKAPFAAGGGYAYSFPLPPQLAATADGPANHKLSRLMMYEDGQPLGLAHSLHEYIGKFGQGRFSHWGDSMIFSASDNSNPNTNGRTYAYCTEY